MTEPTGPHIARWQFQDESGNTIEAWTDCQAGGFYTVLEVGQDGDLRHVADLINKSEVRSAIREQVDFNDFDQRMFIAIQAATSELVLTFGSIHPVPTDLRQSRVDRETLATESKRAYYVKHGRRLVDGRWATYDLATNANALSGKYEDRGWRGIDEVLISVLDDLDRRLDKDG
ncbi:MAG: hypothetical protein H0V98_02415 [Chloroflexia bacterium]|jgi:hypothetical protein|nr:hypothetical protein [Chloroflexia bacterium]